MYQAECITKFRNVGQGLFYTGNIFNHYVNYYFAFDCGTKSKRQFLQSALQEFGKELSLKKKNLDLLIISHFDDDHVNGIDTLLGMVNVDTVIIPYILPLDRLIIALKNDGESGEYYEFLSDPVTYLLDRDVERVIIIGGDDFHEEGNLPPFSPQHDHDKQILFKFEHDDKLKSLFFSVEGDPENKEKLLFTNHGGCIYVNGFWYFRFFNYSVREADLKAFKACLQAEGFDVGTTDKIKTLIMDSVARAKIKDCYAKIDKINNTSLVVFHGPTGDQIKVENTVFYNHNDLCNKLKYNLIPNKNCQIFKITPTKSGSLFKDPGCVYGTILFGDIDLNHNYREIINHFRRSFERTIFVQVPHHGSGPSWNNNILNDIDKYYTFWVIPYGIINPHQHPDNKQLSAIDSRFNKNVFLNNECITVEIQTMVEWI